jgi:hypothetical protein
MALVEPFTMLEAAESLAAQSHSGGQHLFGSEMVRAVRGIDPETGQYFDDTKRYFDALNLSESDRYKIFEGNARKIFPRMKAGNSVPAKDHRLREDEQVQFQYSLTRQSPLGKLCAGEYASQEWV